MQFPLEMSPNPQIVRSVAFIVSPCPISFLHLPFFAEYVEKNWMTDEFFAYQFLNGLNPMIIKRCSKLPEKFPVTNEMVKRFLPDTSTLESEMKVKNVKTLFDQYVLFHTVQYIFLTEIGRAHV